MVSAFVLDHIVRQLMLKEAKQFIALGLFAVLDIQDIPTAKVCFYIIIRIN